MAFKKIPKADDIRPTYPAFGVKNTSQSIDDIKKPVPMKQPEASKRIKAREALGVPGWIDTTIKPETEEKPTILNPFKGAKAEGDIDRAKNLPSRQRKKRSMLDEAGDY